MVTKKLVSATLAVALLLTACGQPSTQLTPTAAPPTPRPELPFAQELQDALESGLEEYGGMGISAAIIVPGYETWVGVSGVSHSTTPITPDTLFSAASIAKMFTAATILQLAEEGVLSLDDALHQWLPDYPNIDNTITIRQLLNHTGGIYDFVRHPEYGETMLADPARSWKPQEIITTFLLEPYFPKGTDWHYSSTGYILLHLIIKEATESELSVQYRNRLWSPLALETTLLAVEETLPENTAHGWFDVDGDGAYDDLPSFTAFYSGIGGGVFSTAEDLARWSQALFHEGRILSDRTYAVESFCCLTRVVRRLGAYWICQTNTSDVQHHNVPPLLRHPTAVSASPAGGGAFPKEMCSPRWGGWLCTAPVGRRMPGAVVPTLHVIQIRIAPRKRI